MSNPQIRKPEPDDPMVIVHVAFNRAISLASWSIEAWDIANAISPLLGHVRIKPCPEGVLVVYKAGPVYQEHTVYAANLADVVRMRWSSLSKELQEAYKLAEENVR